MHDFDDNPSPHNGSQRITLDDVVTVSFGYYHSCAVTSSGDLYVWGSNKYGQLGNPDVGETMYEPGDPILSNVLSVHCGGFHTFAICEDGCYGWGRNEYGQLGINNNMPQTSPLRIDYGLGSVVSFHCGGHFSFVMMNDGATYSFGHNFYGELGLGHTHTPQLTPQLVLALVDVSSIHCGEFFGLALLKSGECLSWGHNDYGQLGLGNNSDFQSPHKLEVDNVVAVDVGNSQAFALIEDGSCYVWGRNDNGQLGLGETSPYVSFPMKLPLSKKIKRICCGGFHAVAVLEDNTCYIWGGNLRGQLGAGHIENDDTPQKLNLQNIFDVHCGGHFTFVISRDGQCFSFGRNDTGQLGLGDNENRLVPDTAPLQFLVTELQVEDLMLLLYNQAKLGKLNSYGTIIETKNSYEYFDEGLLSIRIGDIDNTLFKKRTNEELVILKEYIYFNRLPSTLIGDDIMILDSLEFLMEIAHAYNVPFLVSLLQNRIDYVSKSSEESDVDYELSKYEFDIKLFFETYDLTLVCDGKEIPTKKCVLILFSNFFESLIKYNNQNTYLDIKLPSISVDALIVTMKYLHSFEIPSDLKGVIAFETMRLLDYIDIKDSSVPYTRPLGNMCSCVLKNSSTDESFITALATLEYEDLIYYQNLIPEEIFEQFQDDIRIYEILPSHPIVVTMVEKVYTLETKVHNVENRLDAIEKNLEAILSLLNK